MVAKITLFEPHFDGAQIGPATIGMEEKADVADAVESVDKASTDAKSRSFGRPPLQLAVGLGIVFSVIAAGILVRRRRAKPTDESRDSDTSSGIEATLVEEQVTA